MTFMETWLYEGGGRWGIPNGDWTQTQSRGTHRVAASQKWLQQYMKWQYLHPQNTYFERFWRFWIEHFGSHFKILKLRSQPNKYFVEP